MSAKRTRPNRAVERFGEPVVMVALNAPFPGCCEPYPDATFVNQSLVRLSAHHQGPRCKGYLEPMSMEDWLADVDARNRVRRDDG